MGTSEGLREVHEQIWGPLPKKSREERIAEARALAESYADPYNGSREHDVFREIADLLADDTECST